MTDRATPPVALTVAGSDSGGGAGVQADLKTFAAHGVHGTSALTAVTAQNTAEVRGVVPLEPEFVRLQIQTVLADFDVRAVKTGMLANERIVNTVASLAASGALPRLVVDPVLVSSSGHRLMEDAGVDAYLARLLPHALVATPNLREAAVLGATTVEALAADVGARVEVAEKIRASGVPWVVVKGGHLTDVGRRRGGRTRRRRRARGHPGRHGQRPRHRLFPLGRHRGQPGPGPRRAPGGARRPRPSWPGPWPAGRPGGSGRATGPSTISGGRSGPRLDRPCRSLPTPPPSARRCAAVCRCARP